MMVEWLTNNWLLIAVPVLVFLSSYIVGLWVRRVLVKPLRGGHQEADGKGASW